MRKLLAAAIAVLPLLAAGQVDAAPAAPAASANPGSADLALLGGGLVALGLPGARRKTAGAARQSLSAAPPMVLGSYSP